MNKVTKDTKKMFWISIVLSVLLVVGIPLIIFMASAKIYPLMAVGIAFVVVGFYGSPIAWVQFGAMKQLSAVVLAITEEKIFSVEELCSHFGKNEKEIVCFIEKSIEKRYLVGYKFNGRELVYNDNMNKKHIVAASKCPSCGAPIEDPDAVVCPYCRVGLGNRK